VVYLHLYQIISVGGPSSSEGFQSTYITIVFGLFLVVTGTDTKSTFG
jgi:hypothetical protein